MTHFTAFDPGCFAWVDVNSTDIDASVAFFKELFDLETTEVPVPGGPPYVLFKKDGHQAWGGYPLPDELKASGVPSMFLSYVSVPDTSAAVEKALSLGATTMLEPMDVGNGSMVAIVTDPTGAAIGLMSPGSEPQTTVANEHGTLLWNELRTRDLAAARGFYHELFGWEVKESEFPGGIYLEMKDGDTFRGGGQAIPEDRDDPPHWFVYFQVDDTEATAEKVMEHAHLGAAHGSRRGDDGDRHRSDRGPVRHHDRREPGRLRPA